MTTSNFFDTVTKMFTLSLNIDNSESIFHFEDAQYIIDAHVGEDNLDEMLRHNIRQCNTNIVDSLIKRGVSSASSPDVFLEAVNTGNLDIVKLIYNHNIPSNETISKGFIISARKYHDEVTEFLCNTGIEIEI